MGRSAKDNMFEKETGLLPFKPGAPFRALAVGFDKDSLEEMKDLLRTLGAELIGAELVVLRKVQAGTYLGKGKLEELKVNYASAMPEAIVIDTELSPSQIREIEKIFLLPILDRPSVILEIFSRHARTRESKTQVEVARIQYLLPRLQHFWTHFERQRGGIGNKGMGEKQIEVDRRLLRVRLGNLKSRLEKIRTERAERRRARADLQKVALVGYTNAGKSTLLNALTHSDVKAVDQLFATLDPSVRALDPNSRPAIVAIDTVGFIKNIPTTLIASFRSTLEEAADADVLVHVLDASSEALPEQKLVSEQVLEQLGLHEKQRIVVLNKWDLLKGTQATFRARTAAPGAIPVCALDAESVTKLRDKILELCRGGLERWEVLLPHSEGKIASELHELGVVEQKRYMDQGVFLRVRLQPEVASRLKLARFRV